MTLNKKIRNTRRIPTLALLLCTASPSYAQDAGSPQESEPRQAEETSREDKNEERYRYANRWVFMPSLRYYGFNTLDQLDSVYQTNGLREFNENAVGLGLSFYYRTKNEWQIGFALAGAGEVQEQGAFIAEYSLGHLGAWLAKDILARSSWDVVIGSQVGFGTTELLLLSGGMDGRITQSFAYVEPTILLAYPISSGIKVGVGSSYLVPFELSTEANGDNLGLDSILPKAWTAQVLLMFGSW